MQEVKFIVDKRTELISIVLAYSQCNDYAKEHFLLDIKEEYRERVSQYFDKYKNHNCINLAREIGKNDVGFSYDNVIMLAFLLQPDLTYNGKFTEYLSSELDNIEFIKEFLFEVTDFAKVSNYEQFFENEKEYYQSKIRELQKIFDKQKFSTYISQTLKTKIDDNLIVNIIPMLVNSNHGFKIENNLYANIGLVCDDLESINKFDKGYSHIIIHEFLHPFVNPLTEKYNHCINFELDKDAQNKLSKIGYNNKISFINDTIVRALTIRVREKIDDINAQKFINREHSLGFTKTQDVYNKIIEFENQNKHWNEYFCSILQVFKSNNNEVIKIF